MKRLEVYVQGERAGLLEQDDETLVFSYAAEWLNRPDAMALSRVLPLRVESFRGKKVRAFFAGILPEEDIRRKVAGALGVSVENDFGLLARIGGECAGAISLFPEGAVVSEKRIAGERELDRDGLARVLAELPHRPLLAGEEGVRLSLAGAQGKLPVILREGRIFLPVGNAPSTHILKPEPERFPGLAANELFCLRLARAVGLNTPAAEIGGIGKHRYLIVERYDRIVDPAGAVATRRIHQEDFCQALGIPPERKYQQEGGPLVRDCIQLLREWSTVPVLDIPAFVDGLIFNTLIGNADAHGKNFSWLYDGRERRLAPFYDLICTLGWPGVSDRYSMKVGGCERLREITLGHWRKMAGETGLGWPMIRERIARMIQKVEAELERVLGEMAAINRPICQRVVEIVRDQSARLGT